jgi:hypothetical protein
MTYETVKCKLCGATRTDHNCNVVSWSYEHIRTVHPQIYIELKKNLNEYKKVKKKYKDELGLPLAQLIF